MAIGQIIIYLAMDRQTSIDIKLEKDTFCLKQYQMADLFDTDRTSIEKQIKKIYKSEGLLELATCEKIA
jgi:hypothetical protein